MGSNALITTLDTGVRYLSLVTLSWLDRGTIEQGNWQNLAKKSRRFAQWRQYLLGLGRQWGHTCERVDGHNDDIHINNSSRGVGPIRGALPGWWNKVRPRIYVCIYCTYLCMYIHTIYLYLHMFLYYNHWIKKGMLRYLGKSMNEERLTRGINKANVSVVDWTRWCAQENVSRSNWLFHTTPLRWQHPTEYL